MSKAKFDAVKELINEKRYIEARALLGTIDHPKAREWEQKLDQLTKSRVGATQRVEDTGRSGGRRRIILLLLIVACGLVFWIANDPGVQESSRATRTAQAVSQVATDDALRAANAQTSTAVALTGTPSFTPSPTITDTPLPSSTPLPTSTPSLESIAQEVIERIVVGEIGTVNITAVGSPKLLAVDYEMSGLLDYDLDFSGTEMLRLACELFAAGFNNDWRFQFAAMIQVVDTSTGQTSQDEGLLGRVMSDTVSTWNCENVYSMNPELALDEYRVNPLMNR